MTEPSTDSDNDQTDFLDVICVGFSRTGTKTLSVALNKLGYKCYHSDDVWSDSNIGTHASQWIELSNKLTSNKEITRQDWLKIYSNYNATTDWPSAVFYRQLITLNPNAKVILTIRDKNEWFDSYYATIYNFVLLTFNYWSFSYYLNPLIRSKRGIINIYSNNDVNKRGAIGNIPLIWDKNSIKGRKKYLDMKKRLIRDFDLHTQNVINFMFLKPKQKFLIFEVGKHDWKILCHFLDKPLPAQFDQRIKQSESDGIDSGSLNSQLPLIYQRNKWSEGVHFDELKEKHQIEFDRNCIKLIVFIAISVFVLVRWLHIVDPYFS